VYDPAQAKQLLAAAGYPNGFDAGLYFCDSSYANIAEAVVNNLGEVGIRSKLRPIERAGFLKGFADKAYKNLIQAGPGAFGNAATRLESLVVQGGTFAYGSYPEQMVHERAMYAPIWQLAFINGVGPRVAESGFGRIAGFPYTAPYDELALNGS
jgi:peptide/nickel transport system substrate-binding protein